MYGKTWFVRDGKGWYFLDKITGTDTLAALVSAVLPEGTDWHLKTLSTEGCLRIDLTVYGAAVIAQRLLGNDTIDRLKRSIEERIPVAVRLDLSVDWEEERVAVVEVLGCD